MNSAANGDVDRLRKRAEAILQQNPNQWREADHQDVQHLVHELQVHQVELEMQNDELRRTQEELEKSRRRYFELYDLAPVGYLTLSPQGRITEANLTACDLLGTHRQDLLGKNLLDFTPPPDWEHLKRHLQSLGLSDGKLSCEIAVRRPDDTIFHAYLESLQVKESGPDTVQVRTTFSDITPVVESRQAIQAARDQLESRVKERTAELRHTAADLMERNQELQEFAFIASHDLLEPLRKLQTFSDLLLTRHTDGLDEKGRDYLMRMQRGAGRMEGMLKALLAYSRVGTRGKPFREVALVEVVRAAMGNIELVIESLGARIRVDRLPVIEADFSQMVQLFQNLIANALRFRHAGKVPEIHIYAEDFIRREPVDATGRTRPWCQVFVEDNGIGIEEQYFQRIFTPFERLHGRAAYEGTGMGLSICKKIAQRHGGSISVRSTPGEGATFFITLPLRQQAAETPASEAPPRD